MKINRKEMRSLMYVRDKCKYANYETTNFEICRECPYFEGYCHFGYYLKTQLEDTREG